MTEEQGGSNFSGHVVVDVDHDNGDTNEAASSSTTGFFLLDPKTKHRKRADLSWSDVQMSVPRPSSDNERGYLGCCQTTKHQVEPDQQGADAHLPPERKDILRNVWGQVPSGQVTAIMGPSGSGKTSLLNVLSGRVNSSASGTGDIGIGNSTHSKSNQKKGLHVNGTILWNGQQVDPTDIEVRQKIAFVAQDDSLQVTATPREAIAFSAKLRLPKSTTDSEIQELTESMLSALGLTNCADTFVGGALLKGISGGERKRTSVAVELVTRPHLVFLDEPTSGLDSFNAVQLCLLLKQVAELGGSSVLLTIHQPSSEILESLDRLILLNSGRVMYQGPISEIPEFFAQCNFPNPPHYNPADWILKVALTHTVDELEQAGFFPNPPKATEETSTTGAADFASSGTTGGNRTPGFGKQLKHLLNREEKNLYRNTHTLKARTALTVAGSLLIGCIFFKAAEDDYSEYVNVQSTFGALLILLMVNVFSTVLPSLTAFPEDRPVFLREYSTRHYSVLAYFASKLMVELGISALQVTLSVMLIYLLVGFQASFGALWAGTYFMSLSSQALGVLVGSALENPSVAMEFLPAIFMPQILFAGFFVPPDDIPVWLRWITYISPLTYGVRICLVAEFDGGCAGQIPNYCEQVLDNVNAEPDDTWWYYLVLIALFVVFRLFALITLKKKAEKFY
eukprot:CAMPEP_0168742096 /NCGR_PEP_ID=MMETSP0724-20121128/12860_1 /TAXON_ID=265536 /ORGANISM="Amphiprora sp., Strain CCMP467" /LENGTH=679 /DNA_ID=CAMNT_0008789635 /DNA_START=46 /DNA_END=2085 /DNA_ORIENTATION=+